MIGLLLFSLGSVPPPPPPRAAETPAIRIAIATANDCLAERDGRMEASRATDELADGRKNKTEARRIVKAYVLKRRVQRKCIVDLEDLRRTARMTAGDRQIVNEHVQRLTIFWRQQAEYEIEILSKWFDPELPTDATRLPPRF